MTKLRLRQRFQFFLERQFIKGVQYQLLFVAAFIGLISIVGALLIWPVADADEGAGEVLWWAFLRLTDPGYLGDDEGFWRRVISTILTVAGYVVFLGSLVAIITTWLNRKIRSLEQGLTPVVAKNHFVILGWTNRSIHIAAELYSSEGRLHRFLRSRGTRSFQLIILADDVNPDRVQELKDHPVIGNQAHEIIFRSGQAIDQEHLKRVDSAHASAIILPSATAPENKLLTPDIQTIKALLSLSVEVAALPFDKRPYVVAEMQDNSKIKAAYRAYDGPLEIISGDGIMSRLLAQNLRHPGLSTVYNQLLAQNFRSNIFARNYPEWEGKPHSHWRARFPRALVMGVVRPQGNGFQPMLNIPDEFILKKGDRIILMARTAEDIQPEDAPSASAEMKSDQEARTQHPISTVSRRKKILLLGWNHHVPALLYELGTYPGEQYEITVASLRPLDERKQELQGIELNPNRVHLNQIEADYVKESEIRRLEPQKYDKIVMAGSDRLAEEEEADARTIVGYILLKEVLKEYQAKPQVIMELADPSNQGLIRRFQTEVIIGPIILSHLLAQMALRRELYSVYNELFTVGGAEIVFRDSYNYQLETGPTTFAEVEERIKRFGETVLGYFLPSSDTSERPSFKLPTHRHQRIHLDETIQWVVLTSADQSTFQDE